MPRVAAAASMCPATTCVYRVRAEFAVALSTIYAEGAGYCFRLQLTLPGHKRQHARTNMSTGGNHNLAHAPVGEHFDYGQNWIFVHFHRRVTRGSTRREISDRAPAWDFPDALRKAAQKVCGTLG